MADKAGEDVLPTVLGERPSNYAGDVSVEEAWRVLQGNPRAVLVDVRTRAEWAYVGVPDLSSLHKEPLLIEWQSFPSMEVNAAFGEELVAALGPSRQGAPVLFLCRSGARSKAAAIALTEKGFRACHNIAGGFEGDLDETRHRGRRNGWKAKGLPWVQN